MWAGYVLGMGLSRELKAVVKRWFLAPPWVYLIQQKIEQIEPCKFKQESNIAPYSPMCASAIFLSQIPTFKLFPWLFSIFTISYGFADLHVLIPLYVYIHVYMHKQILWQNSNKCIIFLKTASKHTYEWKCDYRSSQPGLRERKSCFANLTDLFDEMTILVDGVKKLTLFNLDFS